MNIMKKLAPFTRGLTLDRFWATFSDLRRREQRGEAHCMFWLARDAAWPPHSTHGGPDHWRRALWVWKRLRSTGRRIRASAGSGSFRGAQGLTRYKAAAREDFCAEV